MRRISPPFQTKSVLTNTNHFESRSSAQNNNEFFLIFFFPFRVFAHFPESFKLFFGMKRTFIANEPKQFINLKEYSKTVSTLRIPISLQKTFEKGIKKHGKLPTYFGYLIKKYRFHFCTNRIAFSRNVKTEYQERGTKVFVKTFRPELKDWLEFGMWANALNYSICKLFVILLELEEEDSLTVNERAFLYVFVLATTVFRLRSFCLLKGLTKSRTILQRGITFQKPPE